MPHDKHHGSRVRDIHKIVLEVTEEINLDSDDDEEEGVCQLNEQCSLERELEGQMDVQEDDGEGVEKEEEVVMMEGVMYSEEDMGDNVGADMGDNVGSSKEEGSSKKGSSKGVKRDHDAVVGGDDVEERQSEVDPMPPSAKRVRVFQKAKRSRPQAGSSHCEERVGDAMSHPMACLGVSQNCTMQPSMPVIGTSDMIHSAPGPNGAMEIKMKVVLRDIKMESGHSIVSLSAGSGVWGDLRSKKGSSITRIKSANPISLEGCSGITLEPLVSYSMPDRGGGGVGTMIHMKDCSNMRVVCSSFVSEHACGAVAICLQGCTNITIEGCGFYGCGVSIMDGCSMIDISSCRFFSIQPVSSPCPLEPMVRLSTCSTPGIVTLTDCFMASEVHPSSMDITSISNGATTTLSSSLIHASGPWAISMVSCSLIGGCIARASGCASFILDRCTLSIDTRVLACLDTPPSPSQDGLRATLYLESGCELRGCTIGGGVSIIVNSPSGPSPPRTGVTQCSFDSCTFHMQPCEGVRVTPPIRVACDGTSTSFTGETRLIMPLDQAMYSLGTEQELVLLVSGVSGGVATMGGAVTLEFTRALAGTTRGGVSIQDAMSTFMRRCRLFARGGARWPVYVCAEQGLTFSAVLKGGGDGQVPKAVVDTLMGRRRHPSASGDDNTWEVNPQHRDALVRGIGLYLASKCSATIQLSGPCIVPYTIQASSDLTISTLHQSPVAVVALAPAFICMNRPVTVALRNLHVAHVSPLGLAGMFGKTSGYQHRVASQRLEVARKSAALVVGIFEGMVVAESCKFKTDMGWCTTEKGACIVMDSSRTSLRDCTMEVNIPGQVIRDQQLLLRITSGPKVCMCSCPGWGSVVATRVDRCDVPLTEGGCVVG